MAKRIRTTPLLTRIDPAEIQPPTPQRLAELRSAAQIFSNASKAASRPSALQGLGQSMMPAAAPATQAKPVAVQTQPSSGAVESKPAAVPAGPASRAPSTDDIARRAYIIWLRTGGTSEANWLAAEAELRKELGL
jgi:cell division septation protein DedD